MLAVRGKGAAWVELEWKGGGVGTEGVRTGGKREWYGSG